MNLVGQWTEHPAVEEKRAVRGRRGRVGERDSPLLSSPLRPFPLLLSSSPPPEMAAGTINSAAGIYYDDGDRTTVGGTASKFKY